MFNWKVWDVSQRRHRIFSCSKIATFLFGSYEYGVILIIHYINETGKPWIYRIVFSFAYCFRNKGIDYLFLWTGFLSLINSLYEHIKYNTVIFFFFSRSLGYHEFRTVAKISWMFSNNFANFKYFINKKKLAFRNFALSSQC